MRSVIKAGQRILRFLPEQKFSSTVMQARRAVKSCVLTDIHFLKRRSAYPVQHSDTEELLDAKKHPEKHRDLVVRVGASAPTL